MTVIKKNLLSFSSWHLLNRYLFEVPSLSMYIFIIELYSVLPEKHSFAYVYGQVVEVVSFFKLN